MGQLFQPENPGIVEQRFLWAIELPGGAQLWLNALELLALLSVAVRHQSPQGRFQLSAVAWCDGSLACPVHAVTSASGGWSERPR